MNTVNLFNQLDLKGKCRCEESHKPMQDRDYTIYGYYPMRWWGRAVGRYDGRKLLKFHCNKCKHTWTSYNYKDRWWNFLNRHAYDSDGEFMYQYKHNTTLRERLKQWREILHRNK